MAAACAFGRTRSGVTSRAVEREALRARRPTRRAARARRGPASCRASGGLILFGSPGNPVELWESGAILQYLADRYGGLDNPAARADAGKWVVWANASLDPCLFIENDRGQVLDTGARAANGSPRALTRLEATLAERKFLAGDDTFGVADVAVAAYLLYVPMFFADVSFARWPNIAEYMGRCCARPAYARAFGVGTAAALAERIEGWVAERE